MNEKIRRDFRGERIVKFFSFRFVLAGRGVWREGIVRVSRYENFLPLEGGYRVYSPVSIWIQSTPSWNTLGKRRIPTLSRPTRLHSRGLACLLLWLTVLSFRVFIHSIRTSLQDSDYVSPFSNFSIQILSQIYIYPRWIEAWTPKRYKELNHRQSPRYFSNRSSSSSSSSPLW